MIEKSKLNSPIPLPKNESANRGGTNGSVDGVSGAALDRGYLKEPEAEHAQDPMPTYPNEGGCVGRPRAPWTGER